jgi:hypothetical protein
LQRNLPIFKVSDTLKKSSVLDKVMFKDGNDKQLGWISTSRIHIPSLQGIILEPQFLLMDVESVILMV